MVECGNVSFLPKFSMRVQRQHNPTVIAYFLIPPLLLLLVGLACTRAMPVEVFPIDPTGQALAQTVAALLTPMPGTVATLPVIISEGPRLTPTPDHPKVLPTLRTETEIYGVQYGDSLARIAQRYSVSVNAIMASNQITDPNYLEVGQQLVIPAPDLSRAGSDFKIIPDSELVYGPVSTAFDLEGFVRSHAGYLSVHYETVDDLPTSGIAIVQRVAEEYSVNPRLLLAVLEYHAGWVSAASMSNITNGPAYLREYPLIQAEAWRKGLYFQLAWAANQLNSGFYRWRANRVSNLNLADGEFVPPSATINAGTAGVQNLFARLYGRAQWEQAVGSNGLHATYERMFGYPFSLAVEPLIPPDLQQPAFSLPFETGQRWAFTGGPHGGWGDGSAWAALDFAPPGEPVGCIRSDFWITASVSGTIVRTGNGVVMQDVDLNGPRTNDGREQTGWAILYMHIDSFERIQPGTYVNIGDRIGHPSCEGGVSNGTHVHIARRYNGEWISAAGSVPFIMDEWVPLSAGSEYDGYLEKNGQMIEAWDGPREDSKIER